LLVDVHGQRGKPVIAPARYQLLLLDAFGDLDEPRKKYEVLAERVRGLRRRHAELSAAAAAAARAGTPSLRSATNSTRRGSSWASCPSWPSSARSFATPRTCRPSHSTLARTSTTRRAPSFERVGKLLREAQTWAEVDPAYADIARRLEALRSETQDVAETLRDMAERWEANPARQEAVEDRLQLLRGWRQSTARRWTSWSPYQQGLDDQEARLKQQEDDLAAVQARAGRRSANAASSSACTGGQVILLLLQPRLLIVESLLVGDQLVHLLAVLVSSRRRSCKRSSTAS